MTHHETAASFRWANASRITDQLFIGGDLDSRRLTKALRQLDELDAVGITDILDVRIEWGDQNLVAEAKPHLRYHWLGVDDAGQEMPDEWFEAGTGLITEALGHGGCVLVHCHMGINRGPSMGFAGMLALGWDPIQALDRIRARRPIAYIAYAEDALDWWLRKSGASMTDRHAAQAGIRRWRHDNHLDVREAIRKVRTSEAA